MRLIVDRSLFLKVLNHAQSIVERRTTVPILGHVLVQGTGEHLTLTATDLDISYRHALPAQVEKEGGVALPAHMLYDIVRKLPVGQPLVIETQAGHGGGGVQGAVMASIVSGSSRFTLPVLDEEDFPLLQHEELPFQFTMPATELRYLIDATRFAMATEETRYYLNGLHWHLSEPSAEGGTRLFVVATDGHRLARAETNFTGTTGLPPVILSRKTVGELRKIIDETSEDVTVSLSETQVQVAFKDTVLFSRLIDGVYPEYHRVIPEQNDRLLVVSTKAFTEAVDRVATVTSERSRVVKLSLQNQGITISASSSENGSAQEEVAAHYTGEALDIGFNAKYLLDVANHLQGEEMECLILDSAAPVLLRSRASQGIVYVLMPMRV